VARATLIVNPNASRVTPALVSAVQRELGDVDTLFTRSAGHATELAAEAAEAAERIYVYSGDGGYNEAVNGVVGSGVALGFLPGGGTSVLPRALGLPRDPVACARLLARASRPRTISVGRVNGRRFTFSAGLGLDAEVVRAVDRRGRTGGRRAGDLAFAAELAKILLRRRGRLDPALTVQGHGRGAFALVANCDPYTYAGRAPLHVAPAARFEAGLDLVAPVQLRPSRLPYAALSVLVRPRHVHRPWVMHVHDADELRIRCDAPMPLQADGEDLGDVTTAHFQAERHALDVLVSEIMGP
jgi:diacylglycerol kinase family enzyme